MAKEIEFKFLVDKNRLPQLGRRTDLYDDIRQGYLSEPGSPVTTRVRITRWNMANDNRVIATLTLKGPKVGMSCDEYEYKIPLSDACELMNLCGDRVIHKTRHYLPLSHDKSIELDVFHGKLDGLILAEIEVESENDLIEMPDWFVKDVSKDHRYNNVSLVMNGIPKDVY